VINRSVMIYLVIDWLFDFYSSPENLSRILRGHRWRVAHFYLRLALLAFKSEGSLERQCLPRMPYLKEPWFSFLNSKHLVKDKSLPILMSEVWRCRDLNSWPSACETSDLAVICNKRDHPYVIKQISYVMCDKRYQSYT
jgi:hypothetical protein